MKKGNDILDELVSMNSPLADMSRAMPYVVPEHYFEKLSDEALYGIRAITTKDPEILFNKIVPYNTPDHYFNFLPQQVLAAVINDESSLDASKSMPFNIPAGYFNILPAQVLQMAKKADSPVERKKKIAASKRIYIWSQIRLAAAAVLLLGIGFGSLKYYIQPTNPEAALSRVSTNAIDDYVQQNIDDFDIDVIANNSDVTNLSQNAGTSNDKKIQIQTQQLNDEDIVQYLNDTGWSQSE
ncbi:MAG TPA: hypothetical protein VN721_15600 [Flavipsychrobacter sp.]|nr:hypothetical protein [Flavipsychrobacter sp.]